MAINMTINVQVLFLNVQQIWLLAMDFHTEVQTAQGP